MRMLMCWMVLVVSGILAGNVQAAPEKEREHLSPLKFEHQRKGFFLRLGLGLGYGAVLQGHHSTFDKGVAMPVDISLGGYALLNLAIHGSLLNTCEFPNGRRNAYLCLAGIGVGTTYYFMPINIYTSLTIGIARLMISSDETNEIYSTDIGFSMRVLIGKEWWISEQWSVGFAGVFTFATMKDQYPDPEHFHHLSGGLMFSATVN